ncbi:hypothetical protein O181_125018 [Austropuccinia psidii MF-1]|uniref:Uncharacterized protein n=1 Tax=Austropuccinia psidii MF-1 TaxID=1389203 RepID=A0A9Q3Q4N0_9BASI|nr:hypothetical protein [Austropuccinia psidii MF-1]
MTQYRKFIGEYEAIITYLKRYQYIQGDINHNQEILASLSTSVQESIYKEMIKDRAMVQALDGEKKTRFEDESWDEVLKQVKELTQKIVNQPRRNRNNNQEKRFPQNNQPYRPRNPLPPFSSSYQPYIPAQMAPRPPLKCAYCKEESHSATRCTHLAEDLDRIIVRTQGQSYLFPNYPRVLMEVNESVKDIIRAFEKEQAELNKKFMEKPTVKPKPEEEIKPTEKKTEDKSTSIAHVEYWSNWEPPTISPANDPFESHIVLRQKKQRLERQSQNQEPKKKADIPGTYIEEAKEEEIFIIPTKIQNSNIPRPDQPEKEIENIANNNDDEEIPK